MEQESIAHKKGLTDVLVEFEEWLASVTGQADERHELVVLFGEQDLAHTLPAALAAPACALKTVRTPHLCAFSVLLTLRTCSPHTWSDG